MTRYPRTVALLIGILLASPAAPQDAPSAPLPDARSFLEQVRERLHSDEYLLDEYTFTERRTERRFDAKGRVKEEKYEVYEVYPSARRRLTYRKLVAQNGSPLSPDKLAEQDRDHEKKVAKAMAGGAGAEAKREKRSLERAEREREIVDELFRVYDVTIQGREEVDGRSAVIVAFSPRAGVKASHRAGKILQKFAGRAWVDEQDLQLVRAEAELLDTFTYGLGVFARLYKGATASFVRRKVNGEIWLPARARFRGHARLLLVKGLRIDSESEYTDYRKFEVATDEKIEPEEASP